MEANREDGRAAAEREDGRAAAEREDGRGAGEPVVIKVRNNGPYKVTGPVTIIDSDGNEYELPEGDGVVLCRCGGSKTKPFCDKTHSKIGFAAAERAVRELEG